MENQLKKRYGLITAIAMVVGIVVGSGVFFKAEKVLAATGGRMTLGILAWIIGGIIMIACAYTFGVMATKYEKCNGIVDYAEEALGEKYGYMVGWFMAAIYYPTLTSVLAWVSARYLCVLLGWSISGSQCMAIAGFFLVAAFVMNTLSPVIAGKFQVATTIIKLIPLLLMAIVGTIVGLSNGMTVENFSNVVDDSMAPSTALFTAVVATAFAYEGWIIATSINSEIKDSKKNLPRALLFGTILIMVIYIIYYIGLAGAVSNKVMMAGGEEGAKIAFMNVFSSAAGTILFVLIVISCLGTLNGLMLACVRGFYAIAVRGKGYRPDIYSKVDETTNMPTNASVLGLLIAGGWLLYFYGAVITTIDGNASWFGPFSFDTSELPIVTIYAIYIPIFIHFMKKEKEFGALKRIIMPALAILGSVFMVIAAFYAHQISVVYYLIVFVIVMLIGLPKMKSEALK